MMLMILYFSIVHVFQSKEGFVADQDYFVHSTGLTETIKDGDSVEFELEDDPKGKRAINKIALKYFLWPTIFVKV